MATATQFEIEISQRTLQAIVCPLKFVQGYRCNQCSWSKLLPDCHTQWAVPFCYVIHAQREFEQHRCEDHLVQIKPRHPAIHIQ